MSSSRVKKWSLRIVVGLLGLVLLLIVGVWLFLRGSLPQMDGTVHAAGMNGTVTVARDARGVPLIAGANRLDIAYVTGYVHAQERFFQMDLLRRSAAGELAELFGPKALPLDREHRLHRFRARAERIIADMDPADRQLLDRYVAGVNDGLHALSTRPFEYALVGARPRAWYAADSLLVAWAMYNDLQGMTEKRELARGWLRDHSSPEQLAFLLPEQTRWDAPLDGDGAGIADAPIPAQAPAWWGRRAGSAGDAGRVSASASPAAGALASGAALAALQGDSVADIGSNNWAIAGARTTTGAAIVSNDMHLSISLPNTWYRLALQYPGPDGKPRRIVGLTLPGAPPMVLVGSNGKVAWGFTNSYGDYMDLIEAETDTARPGMIRVGTEWESVARTEEIIYAKGQAPEHLVVRETSMGPLREAGGKTYAIHWTADAPGALNTNTLKLESADSVDAALSVAATMGIPAQNFVAGDAQGNIGWTIGGLLPQRGQYGMGSTFPLKPGDAAGWSGRLAPDAYPRVVNPALRQISTANSRQLSGHGAEIIGDGGFDLGARAHQIRDDLAGLDGKIDVARSYGVMLDDRALYMSAWRDRALKALDPAAVQGNPQRAELRRVLREGWTGRASVDSAAYKLTRDFMWAVGAVMYEGANFEMAKLDAKSTMTMATPRWSEVLARLLDAQPAGWLPQGYRSWQQVQLVALDRVIGEQLKSGVPLAKATWGVRNTSEIAHPISMAVPQLRPWLAAPSDQLAGDSHMPRVAGPKFGQSERLTVMPGHEEQAVFNMPGGQSGHPLSPFFLLGHEDWVQGRAEPLLPGPAKYTLTFMR